MKKQVYFYNKRKECVVKRCQMYLYKLKMTGLGVLDTKKTSQR